VRNLETFILVLFAAVAGLNVLANWLDVPYPIPLVLGGLALGVAPGMPEIQLSPELVLLIFLPPLLYSAAFFADLRALRADLRSISLAAIGLVLVTTCAVAFAAHQIIGMSWPIAFVLGAIVSPTDPVAATTILRRLAVPRRLVNIIEGESLLNDATALVAYRVAVTAALGGTFSATHAGLEFLGTAAGGIAVGLAVGWVIGEIRRRLEDATTEVTISLLSAYAAFIPAERLGVSGVLAAVTTGIYLGWRAGDLASPQTRLQTFAVWEILVFLLNATLFILIGLQLPVIINGLDGRSTGQLLGWSAVICGTVIGSRFLWSFTMPYIVRALDRRPQQRARRVGAAARVVSAWSGMRGAVSLAAALALPLRTDAGAPLPDRDLILFVTFAVIVVTIIGEGLTLPWVIRRLGVGGSADEEEAEEIRARLTAARAALDRLDELDGASDVQAETIERVRGVYRFRVRRFKARGGYVEDEDGIENRSMNYQRLMHDLYTVQRQALTALRNQGEISNEVMHRIERELDLEESRLEY
jgi:CPA1 family monovalent cation:H+ antiporter